MATHENDPIDQQKEHEEANWVAALEKRPLRKGDVIVVANNFGTAELLMLRDTFKMPIMIALYTLFVLTACFHAFNGVWTFMIKWGVTLSERSQRVMRTITTVIMVAVTTLGLSAIWLTYWINLKQ
jgi:succinate dehydrogenase / fumarate reductase cytochrome b subunit